ncbi:MAG: hypothetical protein AB7T06_16190 [Kofleriaceae bacterium]
MRTITVPSPSAVPELSVRTAAIDATSAPLVGATNENASMRAPQSVTPTTRRSPMSVAYTAGVPSASPSQRPLAGNVARSGDARLCEPSCATSSSWIACEISGSVHVIVTS